MDKLERSPKPIIVITGIILAVLLCSFGLSYANYLLKMTGMETGLRFFSGRLTIWLLLLVMFLYTRKVERQPLVSWANPKYGVDFHLLGILSILVILFAGNIILGIIAYKAGLLKESKALADLITIFKKYPPLVMFTCITAGVVEELIFRGYMMPRLQKLLGSNVWAIVISSVLFGLVHIGYGTVMQVVGPTFIGLVFAIYYSKYKDLHTLILCHFLWDMMSISLKTAQ